MRYNLVEEVRNHQDMWQKGRGSYDIRKHAALLAVSMVGSDGPRKALRDIISFSGALPLSCTIFLSLCDYHSEPLHWQPPVFLTPLDVPTWKYVNAQQSMGRFVSASHKLFWFLICRGRSYLNSGYFGSEPLQIPSLAMSLADPKKRLPLDISLYSLQGDQLEFFRTTTGIQDEEELKQHILYVQAKAYEVCHISFP